MSTWFKTYNEFAKHAKEVHNIERDKLDDEGFPEYLFPAEPPHYVGGVCPICDDPWYTKPVVVTITLTMAESQWLSDELLLTLDCAAHYKDGVSMRMANAISTKIAEAAPRP